MLKTRSLFVVIVVGLLGALASGCAVEKKEAPVLPNIKSAVSALEEGAAMSPNERLVRLAEAIEKHRIIEFVLGKGDVISIELYGEPEFSMVGVPVRPDGKISFPLLGDVDAAGLTVSGLTEALNTSLRKYFTEPSIAVTVNQFNSLEYTISGELVKPGAYPMTGSTTLTKAVANAAGFAKGSYQGTTVETVDLSNAYVARNGEILPVDFVRLFRQGDLRFDIELQAGDYIYVPSGLSEEVYMLGEVSSPALMAFNDGLTLGVAIAKSLGFSKNADLSRVHVVRGSLETPVLTIIDMNKVLTGERRDFLLEAGDVVYVPATYLSSWTSILANIASGMSALQLLSSF